MTELYFLTLDEVEEGEEVWAFQDGNRLSHARYKKLGGFLVQMDFDNNFPSDGTWKKTLTHNNAKLKFIPVPQDRPKPNIWDEYLSNSNRFVVDRFRGYKSLNHNIVEEHARFFRALAAWIDHVLEKNNG